MITNEDNEREDREFTREWNREVRDTALFIGGFILLAVLTVALIP